jgi:hypothetical protein
MRKMAPPATPCVHHANPSGIEPRIIATLIAASYLMLLFAISRQAILLESYAQHGAKNRPRPSIHSIESRNFYKVGQETFEGDEAQTRE